MSNPKIFPWGPILMRQEVDPNITKKFLNEWPSDGEDVETPLPNLTSRKIYPKSQWKEYESLLAPYINLYLQKMGIQYNFRFRGLWGNLYRQKDSIPLHIHNVCDLTFVLYIKLPPPSLLNLENENEGNVVFIYGEETDARSKVRMVNEYNLTPKLNEIFIFPNNLRHYSIPMTHPKAERISISGNIELL